MALDIDEIRSVADHRAVDQMLDRYNGKLHETVEVRAGTAVTHEIDVEIAPLLHHLWRAGFWTFHSCQGGQVYPERLVRIGDGQYEAEGEQPPGLAYISFMGYDTAHTVADLLEIGEDAFVDQRGPEDHFLRSTLRWEAPLTPTLIERARAL